MRIISAAFVLMFVGTNVGAALDFPEGCRTPGGVVENLQGIDTENAIMTGKHTLPDIIFACQSGWVSQGSMEPAECTNSLLDEGYLDQTLTARASCKAGSVVVEGYKTTFPIEPSCANAGFQAIAAFKTLCPSSEIRLEIK